MLKLFSIFSFVLLYLTVAFGQAAVDFPVVVHDNAGLISTINFGLDLTATDGIDEALGEAGLPGPPPENAYYAAWILPDGVTQSYFDYRAPGDPPAFPFTGNKQYAIKIQSTDFPMTISWSLPSTIAPTSTIKDPFGGGLVNASFSGTDSVVVTLAAIPYLEVSVDYIDIVPVELTSFTAEVSGQGILLKWVTATELNNQGFEIERSTPTQSWEKIGYVPGFGTTTEPRSYSFTDANVVTGLYSYRLKQIDYNGTFSYSNEVEIEVNFTPSEFALFQNYPNPFNPTTTIQFQLPNTSDVSIIIFDMLGQEVRTLIAGQVVAGVHNVDWDGVNDSGVKMSSGSYIYRMTAGEFVQTKEMILLK
jgi:hypothetical protein